MKNSIITTLFTALLATTVASADENKLFQGGFAGVEAGYFKDTDSYDGFYYGTNIAVRGQSDTGLVYGVEGTFGKTSIDTDTRVDSGIDYQWSIMPTVGLAFGDDKRNLIALGAGYAQVKASARYLGREISSTSDGVSGFISYERALGTQISLRVRATTYEFNSYFGTVGVGIRF